MVDQRTHANPAGFSWLRFSQVLYSKKVGYTPDYPTLLQHITRINPEQGAEFASSLVNDESGPLVDIERVSRLSARLALS